MLYLVIFIFFALLAVFLAFLKINIRVEYVRNGWSDHIVLSVYTLWGLIRYRYEASLVNIKNTGFKFMRVKKKKPNKEETKDRGKKSMGIRELFERIKYLKEKGREYKHISGRLNAYLKGKLSLNELDLRIILGTGDAFLTGILGGAAWAIAGVLMAHISNSGWFPKGKIDIKSDFNEQKLDINLHCIISIKFVHIIIVSLIFLSNYLKRRWLHWRNIRYKVS